MFSRMFDFLKTSYFAAGNQGETLSDFFPLPSIENTNQLPSIIPSFDPALLRPNRQTQFQIASDPRNIVTGRQNQLQIASVFSDVVVHVPDSSNPQPDNTNIHELPCSLNVLPDTIRVSLQTCQPLSRIQDYVTYNVKYPISRFMSYHRFSRAYNAFLTSILNVHEPKTFIEAQSQKSMTASHE